MARRWLASPYALIGAASLVSALVAARVGGAGGPWLWNLDLPKLDYPLAVLFHEALAEGRLPLWSDRLGLGFPLYAEGQIGAFYPPNWIVFRLPPLVALDVTRVLHLTFAGVGTALIALRLGGSLPGAVVASAVAVLSGGIVSKLEWTNMLAAYAWFPWVILPLLRRPTPTFAGLVAGGTAWGVQALAGHPQVWLFTGAAALVLLLVPPGAAALRRAVGFSTVGAAIGASQLVSTAVLQAWSVRDAGLSEDDIFTSSATAFDPLLFGFSNAFVRNGTAGWDMFTAWYPDGSFALLEAHAYVGLPVLALAAIGLATRRARRFYAPAALLLLFPVIAAFRPEIWTEVPVLNGMRSPVRTYMLLDLFLGIFAALGLARVIRARPPRRAAALVVGAVVAWYAAVTAVAVGLPNTFEGLLLDSSWSVNLPRERAPEMRELAVAALTQRWPLLLEIGAAVAALAALRVGLPPLARGWALVAIVALPLAALSPQVNEVRPFRDISFAETDFVRAAQAERPHRMLAIDPPGWYPGMPDQLAAAGVPDLRMFSSLNLRSTDETVEAALRGPQAETVRRMLGIDLVATFGSPCPGEPRATVPAEGAELCRVRDALRPPYWIPEEAVAVGPPGARPFDPGEASLDAALVLGAARPATTESWNDARAVVVIDAPAPGWVFVDRAWWPTWEITVDGRPARVLRALGAHVVHVEAGRHRMVEELRPREALLTPLAATLLAGGLWAWHRRPRRVAAGSGPPVEEGA
ncbi:MAG: hypothetical protein ACRDGT_05240 [Candidatus Limnocylindria bacterium]